MNVPTNTRGKNWMITMQVENLKRIGLSEEELHDPETAAKKITALWEASGSKRKAAVAVCVSDKGLYHIHIAATSNTTTLKHVSTVFGQAHAEPQLAGKKTLTAYITKTGDFAEKGEKVLFVCGLENVQDVHGKRSDLEEIEILINDGYTPTEILSTSFAYRKYSTMIREAYIAKRVKETPLIKDMLCEWHVGASGTGKTNTYIQLCEEYGTEQVYLCSDYHHGGFDMYTESGAPPILVLDEFKGQLPYHQLLTVLDRYSRAQVHSRYTNTYCLWTRVVITSVYPPEEAYKLMVTDSQRGIDSVKQLLRRLTTIVYHYITPAGEYKTYSMAADEYVNYEDLKRHASAAEGEEDFRQLTIDDDFPFDSPNR